MFLFGLSGFGLLARSSPPFLWLHPTPSQKPGPTNLLNHQQHQAPLLRLLLLILLLRMRMQMQLAKGDERREDYGGDGTSNKSNECFCKLHLNYPLSLPLPPVEAPLACSFIHSVARSFIWCVCAPVCMQHFLWVAATTWQTSLGSLDPGSRQQHGRAGEVGAWQSGSNSQS